MGVVGVGRDEDGTVAAIGYAVMEEEAKDTGGCGGTCTLLGEDIFHDDFWEVWACFFVVVNVEFCGGEGEGEEEKEEDRECHGGRRRRCLCQEKGQEQKDVLLFSFFLPLLGWFVWERKNESPFEKKLGLRGKIIDLG